MYNRCFLPYLTKLASQIYAFFRIRASILQKNSKINRFFCFFYLDVKKNDYLCALKIYK